MMALSDVSDVAEFIVGLRREAREMLLSQGAEVVLVMLAHERLQAVDDELSTVDAGITRAGERLELAREQHRAVDKQHRAGRAAIVMADDVREEAVAREQLIPLENARQVAASELRTAENKYRDLQQGRERLLSLRAALADVKPGDVSALRWMLKAGK